MKMCANTFKIKPMLSGLNQFVDQQTFIQVFASNSFGNAGNAAELLGYQVGSDPQKMKKQAILKNDLSPKK